MAPKASAATVASAAVRATKATRATTPAQPDPFDAVANLVGNALAAARIMGENSRVASLVAGSVGRMASELEAKAVTSSSADKPGRALIAFALNRIGECADIVPRLHRALSLLLDLASKPCQPPAP